MKFRVVGTRKVGGVAPGGTVELEGDRLIWSLKKGGHIEAVRAPKKKVSKDG